MKLDCSDFIEAPLRCKANGFPFPHPPWTPGVGRAFPQPSIPWE